jgi:hypothetical protein
MLVEVWRVMLWGKTAAISGRRLELARLFGDPPSAAKTDNFASKEKVADAKDWRQHRV